MSNRKTGSDETQSSGSTANTHNTTSTGVDHNVVLPLLVAPGDLEAKNYYAFLPTEPRLLGRTSAGIETFGELPSEVTDERPRKALYKIGNHPIRSCWGVVVDRVEQTLGDIKWTSIDVWRVGYKETDASARPVVVLIGVEDEDVPWAVVAAVLRRLRTLFDDAGLADVQAELRCSQVRPLAGPALLEPVREGFATITEIALRQTVCRAVGQSISPMKHSHSEGALGLYLRPKRQEKEPRLWALTCRHVVLPSTDVPNTHYRRENVSQPAMKIGLPGASALNKALASADKALRSIETVLSDTSKNNYEGKEVDVTYFTTLAGRIAALRRQVVERFSPLEARVLGAVFLSPPIEQGVAMGRRFARDWALIELDSAKFAGGPPINEVDLRGVSQSESALDEIEQRGFPSTLSFNEAILPKITKPGKFAFPGDGILRLSGAFPLSAIHKAPALGIVVDDEEHHLLGKRGPVTGMTWGGRSEIMSRVRHFAAGTGISPFTTDEWAVTGVLDNREGSFSKVGDSGAIVFTADGVVAGMVTSGSTRKEVLLRKVDMAYVTPIALVLQDIEDTLGHEVVVL